MSIANNVHRALEELRKNREDMIRSLRHEEKSSEGSLIGSPMVSIFRISVNKITEQIELLEGMLKAEPRYNFITYFPSVGENLNNVVMTESEVMEELQRMVDDMSAEGDSEAQMTLQFMVDWQHDKTKNAIKFSNDDELYIQEVPE